jgi:ubiquinone/menaquinone biosynthesis C-methylase UbiE
MDFAIPAINMDGHAVLDVGCGNGYALMYPQYAKAKERVGIDVDAAALAEGTAKYPELKLVYGGAEKLPFTNESYDTVVSRVALPYTDIRTAMSEIHRVMKPGGHLFLTMHDWRHHAGFFGSALTNRAVKYVIDHVYIAVASAVFIVTGKVPKRPWNGTRETFQTEGSMRRELAISGFSDAAFSRTAKHWRVTAKK